MLSRLRYKRNVKLFARCLSEKSPENDGKTSEVNKKQSAKDTESESIESSTEKIQALLRSMKLEPKITESEYRAKFVTAPDRTRKPKQDEIEVKTEKIEESITKAAGEVAQALGGNVKQTEAELLSKVLGKINQTSTSLSDLIVGMKVDRSGDGDGVRERGQQVKRLVANAEQTRQAQRETHARVPVKKTSMTQPTTVNIFSGEPLGIFTAREPNHGPQLDVWEQLTAREVTLATTQPPANYLQKMILWTEQGKVWKFPIDNEQGLEEEQNIHFSEHIFLDTHLEGWCPTKGPIRHFMELVCVGLSKNAFYTAQEKKDHIMWYKEYFESKKDMLAEVGAWEISKQSETTA